MFKDNAQEGESSSSSSGDESTESMTETPQAQRASKLEGQNGDSRERTTHGSASPEKASEVRPGQKWNDLFGYQSSILAKLLTPATTGNKKRFEVGLEDKVMLGRPVFAKSDGTWRKLRKQRRSSSRSNVTAERLIKDQHDTRSTRARRKGIMEHNRNETPGHDTSADSQSDGQKHRNTVEIGSSQNQSSHTEGESDEKRSKELCPSIPSHVAKKPLVMFHVVYVLQPPPLEYHIRVNEMYDNIVRKFSKALKWEQSRSNYVANEASLISSITKAFERTSGEERPLAKLYPDIVTQSSLARAIVSLYNNVSGLRIAQLNLTPSLSLSLQIPIATSISVLPTPISPQLPGLWLTTANSLPTDDEAQTAGTQLGSHFTLLLLSNLHSILADINAVESPIAEALTSYLRVSTSTKSFYQISQSSGIPLPDIQFLASHLIYWRRARAIPPLHQRDIYIVSPNADMRKLTAAASVFAKAFPALPSLPHIMSILSSRLRPYSSLIPSKDHKGAYMDVLAWLMRGGWVIQLRTFAWVRVPSLIKDSVVEQMVSSRENKLCESTTTDASASENAAETNGSKNANKSHLKIPQQRQRSTSPSSPIPVTVTPSHASHHAPSILPNPNVASDLPSRHVLAISKFIMERHGKDSQAAWAKCLRYFDGKHALETIPIREGWKRKRAKELLDGWVELGVLVRGRHW